MEGSDLKRGKGRWETAGWLLLEAHSPQRRGGHKTWTSLGKNIDTLTDCEVMQVERKWHILLTIFFLLITSGQCMDSNDVKQKERRTLLDLILQVIRDRQHRVKPINRRCSSGLFTSAQDMKFSSREKPFYVPRLDNSRLIGVSITESTTNATHPTDVIVFKQGHQANVTVAFDSLQYSRTTDEDASSTDAAMVVAGVGLSCAEDNRRDAAPTGASS
ncbi:Protein FAM150-like [Liparis tanakae]|uniref:Protein FAM150-like n=1 Tax=Liparis tanakae TaxID=230148 RepID=A0A4Z2JHT7_9TELE|nr:Protein FAM150-like [Liparis tanakae]